METNSNATRTPPLAGPTKPARLSKTDWLDAGLIVLGKKGAGGVRIDAICKELMVSKGSFYWHFRDRQDLMTGLLDYWDSRETTALIKHVEEALTSPAERIWYVVREVTLGDYNVAVEVAIRHWAYQDATIRQRLESVDAQRLAFFTRQFREHGFSQTQASLRAHTVYSIMLVREFMQTGENREDLHARMSASVDLMLA